MSESNKHSSTVEYNDENPWRSEQNLRELYYGEFMSLPEIADKFGITHQAVLYWFEKHDIERRELTDYYDSTEYSKVKNIAQPRRQMIICSYCGDLFEVILSQVGNRKYCSQECAKSGYSKSDYTKVDVTCGNCGKVFKGKPHRKYCSHDCYSEDIYEGGRNIAELYRGMERRRGWIESVFERDDYVCQRCGDRGGRLQAHHVVPVAEIADDIDDRDSIPEHPLFNDVSNGLTLCIDCHKKHHYDSNNDD